MPAPAATALGARCFSQRTRGAARAARAAGAQPASPRALLAPLRVPSLGAVAALPPCSRHLSRSRVHATAYWQVTLQDVAAGMAVVGSILYTATEAQVVKGERKLIDTIKQGITEKLEDNQKMTDIKLEDNQTMTDIKLEDNLKVIQEIKQVITEKLEDNQKVTDIKLEANLKVIQEIKQVITEKLEDNQKMTDIKLEANQKVIQEIKQVITEKLQDNQKMTDIKLEANQKVTDMKLEKLNAQQTETNTMLQAMHAEAATNQAAVLAAIANVDAALSRLPLPFRSVVVGLRPVAAGDHVAVLVAASRADVAAWLKAGGYEHCVAALAHLDGAALLLQTEASLVAAGVSRHDAQRLLLDIAAAASQPLPTPPTDEPDARTAR